MKTYRSESRHEIGYKWEIEAPEELPAEEVEELQKALINYADIYVDRLMPEVLQLMLNDFDTHCNLSLDKGNIDLYRQVTISVEVVHREAFTQNFEEVA